MPGAHAAERSPGHAENRRTRWCARASTSAQARPHRPAASRCVAHLVERRALTRRRAGRGHGRERSSAAWFRVPGVAPWRRSTDARARGRAAPIRPGPAGTSAGRDDARCMGRHRPDARTGRAPMPAPGRSRRVGADGPGRDRSPTTSASRISSAADGGATDVPGRRPRQSSPSMPPSRAVFPRPVRRHVHVPAGPR